MSTSFTDGVYSARRKKVQPFFRQLRAHNYQEPWCIHFISTLIADGLGLSPRSRAAWSGSLQAAAAVLMCAALLGTMSVLNRAFLPA